jgi:PAS domain S-box-containing protein
VSPRKRARLAFGSAVILLLLCGVSAWITVARFLTAQDAVSHTREVQTALADLTILFGRARRAQIQYLYSGSPAFLQEYQSTTTEISRTLAEIRQKTRDNPIQQQNCNSLDGIVARRMSILRGALQTSRADLSHESSLTRALVAASAEMDAVVKDMDTVEEGLLDVRAGQATRLLRVSAILLFAAFALALGLLLLHYRLLNKELAAREAAEGKFRRLLESAPDAIVVVNREGKIVLANTQTETLFGYGQDELHGQDIDMLVPARFREVHPRHRSAFFEEPRTRAMGAGLDLFGRHKDGREFPVAISLSPLETEAGLLVTSAIRDVSETKSAEANLRMLSGRLLQLQDEERRRIARELHDSAGQLVAALSMNLILLQSHNGEMPDHAAAAIEESVRLVDELSTQLRTISHLLHPPLLDEVGLSSALRWYLDGFTNRSKIKVDLEAPEDIGRLPQDVETAIFRVVQECLTNIHRHSQSAVATVRVTHDESEVCVSVADRGRGIPPEKQSEMHSGAKLGVGIRGMRERVRQLGGRLEIESDSRGTRITARFPLAVKSATAMA